MNILSALGYMTAKRAKEIGCTHHGKYYGIPLWIGDVDNEAPLVCAKWLPFDFVIPIFSIIEGFIQSILYPDQEGGFLFVVGEEIE